MEDVEVIGASALYLMSAYNYFLQVYNRRKIKKPRRKRSMWMLGIHRNRTRESMENTFTELLAEPSGEFCNFCRMSYTDFEYILNKIEPSIAKQDTTWRMSIPAKVRLAVTLRFLATGDSYKSLHYVFKISSSIISLIVPEVCKAINEALKDIVKMPVTPEQWLIKNTFSFPHCIGAMDEKHVVMQSPVHSGSEYYNYKRTFSIVLLALVDSNYCFMYADVGSQGRISDGGVFKQSTLWQKICSNSINFPSPNPLPGGNIDMPYIFVADGAFALSEHVMNPFPGNHEFGTPQHIFNERLSRASVVVENVFGIMASVFRILRKPIALDVEKTSLITMTCIKLHNFLRQSQTSRHNYTPPGSLDTLVEGNIVRTGTWRDDPERCTGLVSIPAVARRSSNIALQTRLAFAEYFAQMNNVLS